MQGGCFKGNCRPTAPHRLRFFAAGHLQVYYAAVREIASFYFLKFQIKKEVTTYIF